MQARVQREPFDLGREVEGLSAGRPEVGAVVSFSGYVRDTPDAPIARMVIEHYPGMTEKALHDICDTAIARWTLIDALVIHRYGELTPGEAIMMVATASAHRADAFEAADFLMDYLKSRAPFWKKEITAQGERWVESRAEDEGALKRWSSDRP